MIAPFNRLGEKQLDLGRFVVPGPRDEELRCRIVAPILAFLGSLNILG